MATGKEMDMRQEEPKYSESVLEGLRITEQLSEKYAAVRKLDSEISAREVEKKRCESVKKSKRLTTPGVPNGFVLGTLLTFLFFVFVCGFIYSALWVENYQLLKTYIPLLSIAPFLMAGIVLGIGFFLDKKDRDYFNSSMDREEKDRAEKIEKLEKEIQKLKKERDEMNESLSQYETDVPEVMRTRGRMELVRQALRSGEAESFPEAVAIVVSKLGK